MTEHKKEIDHNMLQEESLIKIPFQIQPPSQAFLSNFEVRNIGCSNLNRGSEIKIPRNDQNSTRSINRLIKRISEKNKIVLPFRILVSFKKNINRPQFTAVLIRLLFPHERRILIWGLQKNVGYECQERLKKRMGYLIERLRIGIIDEEVEEFIKQYLEAGNERKKHKMKMSRDEFLRWEKQLLNDQTYF